jgi:hypothetical protein
MTKETFTQLIQTGDIMTLAYVFYSENNKNKSYEFDKSNFENYFNNWIAQTGIPMQMCYQIIVKQIKNKLT